MTAAKAVITAIEARRPSLYPNQKQLLLFLAQGHHLVDIGVPLFVEPIYTTDSGVTVEALDAAVGELDNDGLNTIGLVLERYADVSPADLVTLVTASTPWQLARGTGDGRVDWVWLADWFRRPAEVNAEGRPTAAQFAAADAAFLRYRRGAGVAS